MAKTVDSKEKVLAALLTSATRREAAKKAGVSERTVYEYLRDEGFARRYDEARRELVKNATAQLQTGLSPAIGTLHDVVKDEKADPRVRIAAARAMLEYSLKYSELTDVYARLDRLDAQNESDGLYGAITVAVRGQQNENNDHTTD